jgi:hypothetical protein
MKQSSHVKRITQRRGPDQVCKIPSPNDGKARVALSARRRRIHAESSPVPIFLLLRGRKLALVRASCLKNDGAYYRYGISPSPQTRMEARIVRQTDGNNCKEVYRNWLILAN